MHVLAAPVLILLLLLWVSRSSSIHSKHHIGGKASDGTSYNLNSVQNVTIDCKPWAERKATLWQCQRDIVNRLHYGYPWSSNNSQRKHTDSSSNVRNITLRDALDALNQICYIHDRSRICMEKIGFSSDYCLATTDFLDISMDFQFICHHQERDENLVHSLRCLDDTRVLAMLYFHIADRCQGFRILDNMMRRFKNAYFYQLDINPVWDKVNLPRLYCFPRSAISTCISDIVQDHCGAITATFVHNYLVYLQDQFGRALKSAGLHSDICGCEINSDKVITRSSIPPYHTKLGISTLLEITGPGTALDTVWGKYILSYLQGLPGEELCTVSNSDVAYLACVMSSDDRSEKGRFNILQFAHGRFPVLYHGARCSRLESFTACWNQLHEICGSKVRGLEQHATLLVEGCKIQSKMDAVGCPWQDMLLRYYINASHATAWPLTTDCLGNPLFLEDSYYGTINDIMANLDTVISLLQQGAEEIFKKCGSDIRSLLNKLRYLQRDAILKYSQLRKRPGFTGGL